MKYITKPTVEFITETSTDTLLPFANEINTICLAYRQCYSKHPESPLPQPKEEQLPKFLYAASRYLSTNSRMRQIFKSSSETDIAAADDYLLKCFFIAEHLAHESPLEHAKLTVRITNLSRAASHQLVRHRVASYSQQSQRYVGEKDGLVVSLPASIRNNEEAYNTVKELFESTEATMAKLRELGIANEDIRCVYPNAQTTAIVMTANFREWMHIFNERCCTRAQSEIRSLMNQILKYFQDNIPMIFDKAGAKCERLGYCPEPEKFTCGRYITSESLFAQLQFRRIHGNTWVAERNPEVPIPEPINSVDIDMVSVSCDAYYRRVARFSPYYVSLLSLNAMIYNLPFNRAGRMWKSGDELPEARECDIKYVSTKNKSLERPSDSFADRVFNRTKVAICVAHISPNSLPISNIPANLRSQELIGILKWSVNPSTNSHYVSCLHLFPVNPNKTELFHILESLNEQYRASFDEAFMEFAEQVRTNVQVIDASIK